MRRGGFTLIELLISIAVIGILLTIGFKGYTTIVNKAKAQAVISDLDKINKASSETYKITNGLYQGCPPDDNGMSPHKPASTYGYYEEDECTTDTGTKYAKNIEETMYDQMRIMGFNTSDDNTFRLTSIPKGKILFPAEYNGVRTIYIKDIPGEIAMEVLQNINTNSRITDKDGTDTSNRIVIMNCKNVESTSTTTGEDESTAGYVNFIIGQLGCERFTKSNNSETSTATIKGITVDLSDYIRKQPSVGLLYVVQFGEAW